MIVCGLDDISCLSLKGCQFCVELLCYLDEVLLYFTLLVSLCMFDGLFILL